MLKKWTLEDYPSMTFGEIVKKNFMNSTWLKKKDIVEVTGEIEKNNELQTITLHFFYDKEKQKFEFREYLLNGSTQTNKQYIALFDTLYNISTKEKQDVSLIEANQKKTDEKKEDKKTKKRDDYKNKLISRMDIFEETEIAKLVETEQTTEDLYNHNLALYKQWDNELNTIYKLIVERIS